MYHQPTLMQHNSQNAQQQGQIKIIGNYQYNLRYCLGEGAYGKVYEGIETKTQRKIAIKKMDIKSFERDTYLKNQIISEIEILKRFNHRNIVQFIDLITTQRSLYIITEYCQNGDLRALMQHKRLSEEQSIKILKHIIEGFKELIKHNVIHRDLKPANILVHDGVFKIADFGFAKFVDYSSAQMLRSCVGSPLYMAPQILKRQQYGTKCDIWSLGVIFHEMIFHDVPWKARDERELLNNIMTQPYRIRPGAKISKFSEDLLKKMLVIDEQKRISWDVLFEMCKNHEDGSKANLQKIIPTTQLGGNKENQGLYQKANQYGGQNNGNDKIRKSIFDKPETKPSQDNVLKNNDKPQFSNLSQSQKQKMEITKLFVNYNQLRSEVVFRHSVCVDLFTKFQINKSLIKTELVYEKFIITLSQSIQSQSFNLMKQIRDSEFKNEDLFTKSPELQALSLTIKKENDFYRQFVDDLLEQFQLQGILDNLKSEPDLVFLFQDVYTDQEVQKLEQMIHNYGKDVCREIIGEIKVRKLEEGLRRGIISVDYIMDVILSKKKQQKGQDVSYDNLHIEKSEQHDLKHYFDKTISRMQLFQTTFNFF